MFVSLNVWYQYVKNSRDMLCRNLNQVHSPLMCGIIVFYLKWQNNICLKFIHQNAAYFEKGKSAIPACQRSTKARYYRLLLSPCQI